MHESTLAAYTVFSVLTPSTTTLAGTYAQLHSGGEIAVADSHIASMWIGLCTRRRCAAREINSSIESCMIRGVREIVSLVDTLPLSDADS